MQISSLVHFIASFLRCRLTLQPSDRLLSHGSTHVGDTFSFSFPGWVAPPHTPPHPPSHHSCSPIVSLQEQLIGLATFLRRLFSLHPPTPPHPFPHSCRCVIFSSSLPADRQTDRPCLPGLPVWLRHPAAASMLVSESDIQCEILI